MKNIIILLAVSALLIACAGNGPEPVLLNKDACASCKMSISEGNFAAELITPKGRVYKFDDIQCMRDYVKANAEVGSGKFYVGDYQKENELIDAAAAWYVQSEQIKSPMGGHTAAFAEKEAAEKLAAVYGVSIKSWSEVSALAPSGNSNEHHH